MIKNKTGFNDYDVIIVGAGHAGCEAALSSSSLGAKTLIITINLDSIALMPCNSAIGGPGRGHLVREIDALGGTIAKNADKNYIHSRIMNISKGPALRTLRVIVDKKRYLLNMKYVLENNDNLDIRQGLVKEIVKKDNVYEVKTSDGNKYRCKSIVISAGTFLRAKIFWGSYEISAGRQGEINSVKLAKSLENMGYRFGRLRTETPPRVDARTIDFNSLITQPYDEPAEMFSYDSKYVPVKQMNNYITYVEKDCIDFISKNIKKSPVYGNKLESKNPGYCPSIEDKVKKFYNKARHPVFLQPEGKDTNEIYLHGLFTTFSEDIQQGIISRIKGLENAVITRPGYGVEYDYLLPYQIKKNLESKTDKGLFFAGQVNGTTGYEEAAAQGIIAGFNAALKSSGKKPITLEREDGYMGILIDDITQKSVTEPYRILTSRNEYRLFHRHDNADFRMIKFLKQTDQLQKAYFISKKYEKINQAFKNIKNSDIYRRKNIIEDIKQNRADKNIIYGIKKDFLLDDRELEGLIINIKYEIYFEREIEIIEKNRSLLKMNIPDDINYFKIRNISAEGREALTKKMPGMVSQAAKLEGVRPTDIIVLMKYIKDVSRET
ncbi:MAG: tRNA uridine-5-carboxymethylaminomethyl(34) synthesis enzyme MnmG [Actinobacteria bacterium]|nr:tRNA uridine-5-carboxymethylaminomethyl(34) synthesis enzyme MnmG [Actinomycetota bacterium]